MEGHVTARRHCTFVGGWEMKSSVVAWVCISYLNSFVIFLIDIYL